MKVKKRYLYFLITVVALYTYFELTKPAELDWSETYHFRDKIPFGTQVTHDLLQDITGGEATHTFRTPYELITTEANDDNILMLSSVSTTSKLDVEALLEHSAKGHTVLIGAENFRGALADTLGFGMAFDEQILSSNVSDMQEALAGESIMDVNFVNSTFPNETYSFPSVAVSTFFIDIADSSFETLAVNEEDQPVLIRYRAIDDGALFLTTIPLALTNYFVLSEETASFAESLLSLFPEGESLTHNEYYQMGRMESSSIFRFLLRHEALRWAYFTTLVSIIFFVLFEVKRRQRPIPIMTPLKNTTLEFVSTLGRLHYRQLNHTNLAKKRVQYWLEFVRSHYNISTRTLDDEFVNELSKKSGKDRRWLELLSKTASKVQEDGKLQESELMAFEKLLNKFYGLESKEHG